MMWLITAQSILAGRRVAPPTCMRDCRVQSRTIEHACILIKSEGFGLAFVRLWLGADRPENMTSLTSTRTVLHS